MAGEAYVGEVDLGLAERICGAEEDSLGRLVTKPCLWCHLLDLPCDGTPPDLPEGANPRDWAPDPAERERWFGLLVAQGGITKEQYEQ